MKKKERPKISAKVMPNGTKLEDTKIKKVHKGGNTIKEYGRVYVPADWVGKFVHIGVIKK